jgi:diguanylate cyclase (GGDEF)-like protein/PAS domain S-box-containing protein
MESVPPEEDLSARLAALEAANTALRLEVERFQGVFNQAQEGLLLLDTEHVIREVNDTVLDLLGCQRSDLIGRRPETLYDRHSVDVFSASAKHLSFEARFATRDGEGVDLLFNRGALRGSDGQLAGFAVFLIDLRELKLTQEELRRSEERYRQLAFHDSLTGLFNTRHLYSALEDLTYHWRTSGIPFALIFMDMDNFKTVVDTYGHLNGSQALAEVAATIRACLEGPDFGVAYGGDEFVVVLPGRDRAGAREVARRIQARMEITAYLAARGLRVELRASFGLAACPDDGTEQRVLLALADQAMFRVKARGKHGIDAGPTGVG